MSVQYEKIFSTLLYVSITAMLLVDVSPLPLSISMAMLFIIPFFYIKPIYIFKNLKNNRSMLFLMLCFVVLLPSFFYNQNNAYLLERLQIHLPFLLLPIAFANAPDINIQTFARIILWFALQVFVIAFIAIIYYIFNASEVNQRYLESQVMPTILTHHPTFSMMIAYSIYAIYYIIIANKIPLKRWQTNTLWLIMFFLFVFQHIYSVRIGLLALYMLIGIEISRLVLVTKQYLPAFLGLSTILLIAFVTIRFSPTVQNKIKNTQADIQVLQQNQNATHHSIAMRLVSYQIALSIIKEHPFIGVGLGNLKDELEKQYRLKHPEMTEKKIIPHNMFLFLSAAIGLIGAGLFAFGLFYGFLFQLKLNPHLLNIHYMMIFFYAMVEAGTQTQLGVAYIILIVSIGLKTKTNRL